ncbi:MAG: hypothetical protein ACKVP2_15885 [Burkholderiales bacterium]
MIVPRRWPHRRGGYDKKTVANDVWRLMHEVLGEKRMFVFDETARDER